MLFFELVIKKKDKKKVIWAKTILNRKTKNMSDVQSYERLKSWLDSSKR